MRTRSLTLPGQIWRVIDLAFLLALSIYVLAGSDLAPFHADESTIIFMSRDYAYQFIDGDLDRIRYDPDALLTNETQLRLINGTVSKMLIGLAWHSAGYTIDDLNTDWDWGGDWEYNLAANHLPSDDLLHTARLPQALLMAASVWAMFALGWRLGGRGTAYFAALYLALCPPLLLNGRRAMMEAALTCFSLLTILAAAGWIAVWRRGRRAIGASLLLGAAAGLTIASKHTGVVIAGAALAACVLAVVWSSWRERRRLTGLLPVAGAVLLALGVFYLLNPAWWGADIPALFGQILDWRTALLDGQTRAFGGYASLDDRLAGWLRQVLIAQPQYFEVESWGAIPTITEQIARYEASVWRGLPLGGGWPGAALIGLLAIIGVLRLLRGDDQNTGARLSVGLWAGAAVLTALASPVEWQRYYLPVYPAVGLLAAHGLTQVSRTLVLVSHSRKRIT